MSLQTRGRPSETYPEAVRSLPVTAWPPADQTAWMNACAKGGPLDPDGPALVWAHATRHLAEHTWGGFLNVLRLWDELDPNASPGSRMTADRLTRYIRLRRETAAPNTVAHNVIRLGQILSVMCPDRDWLWIRRHPERPGTAEVRASQEKHVAPDLPALFDGCMSIMSVADEHPTSIQNAVVFRDGLIGALLCAVPIRRRNLVELTIGRDVLVDDWGIEIAIDGADTKNGRAISTVLEPNVAGWMRRYLDVYRPVLLRDQDSDRLWFGRRGEPLDYYAFGRIMKDLGLAVLGRPITAHMHRHAVATFTMARDPRNGPIAMDLLSHRTARTVDQYYDRSGRRPAQDAWEQILRDARRKAEEEVE